MEDAVGLSAVAVSVLSWAHSSLKQYTALSSRRRIIRSSSRCSRYCLRVPSLHYHGCQADGDADHGEHDRADSVDLRLHSESDLRIDAKGELGSSRAGSES